MVMKGCVRKAVSWLLVLVFVISPLLDIFAAAGLGQAASAMTVGAVDTYAQWKNELANEGEEAPGLIPSALHVLANEFIEVAVNQQGEFSVGSRELGSPLLYGHPDPWSSYTTIKVDGQSVRFRAATLEVNDRAIRATMVLGSVTVEQVLAIVHNEVTDREDLVKIAYNIHNTGPVAANVGTRILLDTMVAENDGAPFRVPNHGEFSLEREFTGTQVPQFWQAFDSGIAPMVVQGIFYNNIHERPDKVQFVRWSPSYSRLWDYDVTPHASLTGDSAVAIYYEPRVLNPDQFVTRTTYYGLGDVKSGDVGQGDVRITASAPQVLTADHAASNYSPNPFTVVAYVRNQGTQTLDVAEASLAIPANSGLSLLSPRDVALHNLVPNEERTVSWRVSAAPQNAARTVYYRIVVSAVGTATATLEKTIVLPEVTPIDTGSITLNKATFSLNTGAAERLVASLSGLAGSITWMSSNINVATVDDTGQVRARAGGTATITASLAGKTASSRVTVTAPPPPALQSISFTQTSLTIYIDRSQDLAVIFNPANAGNKRIRSWTSSDTRIATVSSSGRVTGRRAGTVTITAVSESGNRVATCTVTVVSPTIEIPFSPDIAFSTSVSGPILRFMGKDFTLFNIPVGTEISFAKKVKLQYDPYTKEFVGLFGNFKDPNFENSDYHQEAYQIIRSLLNRTGRSTNRQLYNSWNNLAKKRAPVVFSGNMTAFGYITFVDINGRLVLKEGMFGLLADASWTWKQPVPVPAVFLKFAIKGEAQGGLKLQLKEVGNIYGGIVPYGSFSGTASLSGAIGADIILANVYGGAEGKLKSKLNVPLGKTFALARDFELDAEFDVFIEYGIWLYGDKRSWRFGHWPLYPRPASGAQAHLLEINLDELPLLPRDYLNMDSLSAQSLDGATMIKPHIFPNSTTRLLDLGGGRRMLLWLDDLPSRSSANRTALHYATYNPASGWSAPYVLDDDGTADLYFDAYACGDTVYVVWENADKVFSDDVLLSEMAQQIGLKAAIMDGDIVTIYDLTEADDGLDKLPSLSKYGDVVTVTWVNNDAGAIDGLTGNNSILRTSLNSDIWSATEVLASLTLPVTSLNTTYFSGEHFSAYTSGEDESSHIFVIEGSAPPVQVTDSGLSNTYPLLKPTGDKLGLYWLSDGAILYQEDFAGEVVTVVDEVSVAEGFDIIENGQTKMLYWHTLEGFGGMVYGVYWDQAAGRWSGPVSLLDSGGRLRGVTGVVAEDGSLNMAYAFAPVVDDSGDDYPYGSSSLYYMELEPEYNLRVEGEVLYDRTLVEPGAALPLHVAVHNAGQRRVDHVLVEILDVEHNVRQSSVVPKVLLPGEWAELETTYALPVDLVKHNLVVRVLPYSPSEALTDADPSDNTASVTMGHANVTVSAISVSGAGSTRTVEATLTNTGYGPISRPMLVSLYAGDSDEPIATRTIGVLSPQGSARRSFTLDIGQFDFAVDSDDVILELVVDCHPDDAISPVASTGRIVNPYTREAVTIGAAALAGHRLFFNLANNLPEANRGVLVVQRDVIDDDVATYGQYLNLTGFSDETMELDVSAILGGEGDRVNIFVVNDNDEVISNISSVALTAAATAHFSDVVVNVGTDNRLAITGRIGVGSRNVTVKVIDPRGVVDYLDQNTTDTDGSFSFSYFIGTPISGFYQVTLSGEGLQTPHIETYYYGDSMVPFILGDVNGDGHINAADIVPLNRHALGIEIMTCPRMLAAADVNGDGHVNAADIVPLNRHALGVEVLQMLHAPAVAD